MNNMHDMSADVQEILENILDAGNVLIYSHDTMSFNLYTVSIYDMGAIYPRFVSETRTGQNTIFYQVKQNAIDEIKRRKQYTRTKSE